MQAQGKVYGFTISLFEYIETIPSLWDSVKGKCNDLDLIYAPVVIRRTLKLISRLTPPRSDFIKKYPEYIPEGNGMKFLSDDGGETYNRCHCELFICSALALCL